MGRPFSPLAALGVCACAACGGDAPRVRLQPIDDGTGCGRPAGAVAVLVTPLGELAADRIAIVPGAAVELGDLPAGTRQLAVEVIGPGGAVAAIGKTDRFELDQLADGSVLPIAMAPLDGFCPAGAMATPRDRPLVAAGGDGVLVAGGNAPGGAPLATAERFEPGGDRFVDVPLPAGFIGARGLAGASLVALSDGRVALVGGPSPGFAVYTPGAGFGAATLVTETRAHAAAVALDDAHVLLAGGCDQLASDGACTAGSARADCRVIDLVHGTIAAGPTLAADRYDAIARVELGPDGARRVLVIGGVDPAGAAMTTSERLDLDGGSAEVIAGTGAAAAALDSGAVVTGFAPAGAAPGGATAAILPGADARALPTTSARAGAALVTQEDGLVIAIGGGGPPMRYRPASNTWRVLPAAPGDPALPGGHVAIRLGDGSILVVGGDDATAHRFRPRLLGALTGALTVVPSDDESEPPLAPIDPDLVERGAGWRLRSAPGGGDSHAIVGGPDGGDLRLELVATVPPQGVAVLLGYSDPADLDRALLVPNQAAVLERRSGGVTTTACRGEEVPGGGLSTITASRSGDVVRVVIGGKVVLSCDVDPRPRGRLGVAAIGGTVGIETLSVNR